MQNCIKQGLLSMGTLPGGLDIERRAYSLYHGGHMDESAATRENRLICAYAFAAGEQNAGGGFGPGVDPSVDIPAGKQAQ